MIPSFYFYQAITEIFIGFSSFKVMVSIYLSIHFGFQEINCISSIGLFDLHYSAVISDFF